MKYLEHDLNSNGFKVYDPKQKTFSITRDIQFLESTYKSSNIRKRCDESKNHIKKRNPNPEHHELISPDSNLFKKQQKMLNSNTYEQHQKNFQTQQQIKYRELLQVQIYN